MKSGTEYTTSGVAIRTFTIPMSDVHAATLNAFRRAQLIVVKDEVSKKGQLLITGDARHRSARVRITPLTGSLTQVELHVKRNILASDKATASELLTETERTLAENPEFAARLADPTTATVSR